MESDAWTDLGEYVTEALKVDDYQLFQVEPTEAQYIRITFIKGHLKKLLYRLGLLRSRERFHGRLTGIHFTTDNYFC